MADNVYSISGWKARELSELIRNWLRGNRSISWEQASPALRYEAIAAVVREMASEAMRETEARHGSDANASTTSPWSSSWGVRWETTFSISS